MGKGGCFAGSQKARTGRSGVCLDREPLQTKEKLNITLDYIQFFTNIYDMRYMRYLYSHKGLLKSALAALAASLGAAPLRAVPPDEPEPSPLYARSMEAAFADMTARGHADPQRMSGGTTVVPGAIIVVEGAQWRHATGTETERALQLARANYVPGASAAKPRPVPLDVTTDISCSMPTMCTTCYATTCGASCDATPTCRAYPSCHVPGPTCIYQTCTGGTTCNGGPTCIGVSCTQSGPTCFPGPTCQAPTCTGGSTCDGTATCTGFPTCIGTCVPANCPTTVSDVSVPQSGQILLSFSSSTHLKYVLQYCTNLAAGVWLEACTTNGNGGVLTLGHTNGTPIALYRLVIQTP